VLIIRQTAGADGMFIYFLAPFFIWLRVIIVTYSRLDRFESRIAVSIKVSCIVNLSHCRQAC